MSRITSEERVLLQDKDFFVDLTSLKTRWITNVRCLAKEVKRVCAKEIRNGTRHNLGPGIYFRGQSNIGDHLLPSIGRKKRKNRRPWIFCGREIEKFNENQERNLLHRFRRRSYRDFGRLLSWWEALFLARHYGLPTRLLDWTGNSLVALYFASVFEDKPKQHGAVWAIVRHPGEGDDLNVLSARTCLFANPDYQYGRESEFAIEGVKIIYPFDNSGRLIAQQGIFTIQENPWKALDRYKPSRFKDKKEHFDIRRIYKWKVPRRNKPKLIEDLRRHGISHQALFPDIKGLADGILKEEIFRSGKEV